MPEPLSPLFPPATIGIIGGGQLERMSILAARRMGYRFQVLEPKANCSAGMVADKEITAAYDDLDAVRELARASDRVTLMFENVPEAALNAVAEEGRAVHPSAEVLRICQNRQLEKEFLRKNGFPCAPFAVVRSAEDVKEAVDRLGRPAVLKTAAFGYDGKGQYKIDAETDLEAIWREMNFHTGVVEQWIPFKGEFSVICARSGNGEESVFPVAENIHKNHILHTTIVPARIGPDLEAEARSLALEIARTLDIVGLLAVELFLNNGQWLVNELAPRPHNSGHYTYDACVTSQFEQHIRAVCALPMGSPRLLSPVVMVNLLGDVWRNKAPAWEVLLRDPSVRLHLYDKGEPRPGRKMGHFCVLDENCEEALKRAQDLEQQLFEEQSAVRQPV